MLKRIALLGTTASLAKELGSEASAHDVEVVHLNDGDNVPAATTAAIAGSKAGSRAIETALEIGAQHEELLELIAHAIDSREDLEPGSSHRVREYATRFAKALGLSAQDQLTLERGALLRDIGKLKIGNSVLLKYSLLTHDEWKMIQDHTQIGGDLVRKSKALRDIEDVVRRHHECFDGTGYPDGLEGDAIPILAQALKLVDVYCAMTGKRHYRPSRASTSEAIDHIKNEMGKHFHPELARVFIESGVAQT